MEVRLAFDPIDQIGPIGGSLSTVTAAAMAPYSGNTNYAPVNADGGKSFIGGYRAERNALLKFIVDNGSKNVVFLSTDDHQNRINEVLYSPSGRTGPTSGGFAQSDFVNVPYCFSIVCGPLGATGPDLFLNHDFNSVKGAADLIADAQIAAGVEPIGLLGYPGLHNVMRDKGSGLVNGSEVPIKFSLGCDRGLAIFAPGYPQSAPIACSGAVTVDDVEETSSAGGHSLSYDPATHQYVYVWRTEKAWAGSCRLLRVKLADDNVHDAYFTFTK